MCLTLSARPGQSQQQTLCRTQNQLRGAIPVQTREFSHHTAKGLAREDTGRGRGLSIDVLTLSNPMDYLTVRPGRCIAAKNAVGTSPRSSRYRLDVRQRRGPPVDKCPTLV